MPVGRSRITFRYRASFTGEAEIICGVSVGGNGFYPSEFETVGGFDIVRIICDDPGVPTASVVTVAMEANDTLSAPAPQEVIIFEGKVIYELLPPE